ncbi:Detected protein of unknown function [Hibiscus syriacus]|uniref:Uncharacterized protein n=1 Tax=Hibiscus syriacus TaxID=106335 RepID=A0A6A2WHU4_HIBSY|nr:uncharacterized protein LOC120196071 isoform X1 [Hibiscus syriacus]KAE8655505.1 Detected protein of unknown function [Hibiscus syriacus]
MSEDEWVTQALTDSTLAAKVLLSLFQPVSPPSRSGNATFKALQLEWRVRQRRSKQSLKKKAEPTRASPNTPLSWSGGVSFSGSGSCDGYEESSRPPLKPVDNSRSKVETTNEITPPKRFRRKKTLAELKEDISSHLKENKSLKNELEMVKLKFQNVRTENETLNRKLEFEKARASNESSKRMKFDYHSHLHPNDAISEVHQQREATCHASIACNEDKPPMPNRRSEGWNMGMASRNETSFELPDLNLPVEDGSGF